MDKKLLYLWIIIYCLTACSETQPSKEIDKTSIPTYPVQTSSNTAPVPTFSPSLDQPTTNPTLTITPTLTPGMSTQTNTLTTIDPEITRICPQQAEVPLESFTLNDVVLIVDPYEAQPELKSMAESGAFVVTLDDLVQQQVPNTANRNGLNLVDYIATDDRKLIQLEYTDREGSFQIWRSSWNGQQQEKVLEITLPEDQGPQFLGEDKFMIIRHDLSSYSEYPLAIYDVETGEEWDFPPFPDGVQIKQVFSMQGNFYMLYYQGIDVNNLVLYNIDTRTTSPVFQWLIGKDWVTSINNSFGYVDGSFWALITRDYGYDLAINLDLSTIESSTAYDEVMQPINLPGVDAKTATYSTPISAWVFLYWLENMKGDSVYLFDAQNLSLKEYCFSVEIKDYSYLHTSAVVSPDGRYAVFTTSYYLPNDISTIYHLIRILDLFTGEFARIPDANYEVIGWINK